MAIKRKNKIMIAIIILIILILSIMTLLTLLSMKFKNSYIFIISNALNKTKNASSLKFVLDYKNEDDELNVTASVEYDFKNLDFLVSGLCNNEKIAANIGKKESVIGYYIDGFRYWLTIDVSKFASNILEKISKFGEKSFEEEFPVKDLLELVDIDDKIDISKYPNKLTKRFMLQFVNDDFLNNVLEYKKENKNGFIRYAVNPNMYELLKEFIKTSSLNGNDKKSLNEELEKNKKELEMIDLNLSIIINEDGYIQEFCYTQIEEGNVKSIDLKLDNINNAVVELDEKVLKKLDK